MSNGNPYGRRSNDRRPRTLAYLLRLWETRDGERTIWRASLERPGAVERLGFESVADLAAYLIREMEAGEEAGGDI